MGRYDRYEKEQSKQGIHPVWRGIGCLMLILIPVMAYAAADQFSTIAPNLTIGGIPVFPYTSSMYGMFYPFQQWEFFRQAGILPLLLNFGFIPIIALFTILFTVIGFMIFSMIYAIVYRVTGPPKYGPTDAPPLRKSRKKRRR
jgi:hypothetical protein